MKSIMMLSILGLVPPVAVAGQQGFERSGEAKRQDPATFHDTPIVLAQGTAGNTTPPANFIFNQCQEIDHQKGPTSAFHVVDPAGMLSVYWASVGNKLDLADIKVKLLQSTQHGSLSSGVDSLGFISYYYDPAPGYLGDDQAKFMTDAVYEGKHYRTMIIIKIKVLKSVNERAPTCPDPVMIKAPKPATGDAGFGAGYNLAFVTVTFADLQGAAIGQTTGSTITLDTTAANYGSMGSDSIDYTLSPSPSPASGRGEFGLVRLF